MWCEASMLGEIISSSAVMGEGGVWLRVWKLLVRVKSVENGLFFADATRG